MPSAGRYFEGAFDVLLAFHIVEINLVLGVLGKEGVDVNNGRVEGAAHR